MSRKPEMLLIVTHKAYGVEGQRTDFAGLTDEGRALPDGNYELFRRTPEERETLLAAASLIENPRVILPDDKALAAKLRAMAGDGT